MSLLDRDDAEPLPTDGMEVEEFRDADTVRLFMLEWRRRMRRELPGSTRAEFLGGNAARVFRL